MVLPSDEAEKLWNLLEVIALVSAGHGMQALAGRQLNTVSDCFSTADVFTLSLTNELPHLLYSGNLELVATRKSP